MISAFTTALLVASTSAFVGTPTSSCAAEVQATATAYRLSDLPAAIRADLALQSNNEMADSGTPLWQTDVINKADRNFASSRFVQALLVRKTWFVSYEATMTGSRTIGYYFKEGGGIRRKYSIQFSGPPCEAIKAALKGVGSF